MDSDKKAKLEAMKAKSAALRLKRDQEVGRENLVGAPAPKVAAGGSTRKEKIPVDDALKKAKAAK